MSDKYILEDGEPVKCKNLLAWARWMETGERQIAADDIGGVRVSTVFLGRDHAFGSGRPVLFETMIFGGPHDEYQERYCTREQAVIGHSRALALVRSGEPETADAVGQPTDTTT